jgi:RNA polymerase subunit RPABC4/transcription elongation factor Spt4
MVFCSKCGNKLPEDSYFCPKCGVRTQKGIEAGVSTPAEELREAFSKMGQEMEKAFAVASKEIQEAFKTARERIRQSVGEEPTNCPNCGEKASPGANFCHK